MIAMLAICVIILGVACFAFRGLFAVWRDAIDFSRGEPWYIPVVEFLPTAGAVCFAVGLLALLFDQLLN